MVIPIRNEGLKKGERYLSPKEWEEWKAKKRGCSAMVEQHPKPLTKEEIKEINKRMIKEMKEMQDKIGFKTEVLNVENLKGVN